MLLVAPTSLRPPKERTYLPDSLIETDRRLISTARLPTENPTAIQPIAAESAVGWRHILANTKNSRLHFLPVDAEYVISISDEKDVPPPDNAARHKELWKDALRHHFD